MWFNIGMKLKSDAQRVLLNRIAGFWVCLAVVVFAGHASADLVFTSISNTASADFVPTNTGNPANASSQAGQSHAEYQLSPTLATFAGVANGTTSADFTAGMVSANPQTLYVRGVLAFTSNSDGGGGSAFATVSSGSSASVSHSADHNGPNTVSFTDTLPVPAGNHGSAAFGSRAVHGLQGSYRVTISTLPPGSDQQFPVLPDNITQHPKDLPPMHFPSFPNPQWVDAPPRGYEGQGDIYSKPIFIHVQGDLGVRFPMVGFGTTVSGGTVSAGGQFLGSVPGNGTFVFGSLHTPGPVAAPSDTTPIFDGTTVSEFDLDLTAITNDTVPLLLSTTTSDPTAGFTITYTPEPSSLGAAGVCLLWSLGRRRRNGCRTI